MERYTTLFSRESVDFALDAAYTANTTYDARQSNTDENKELMLQMLFNTLMDMAGIVLAPQGDFGEHYERFNAVKKAYLTRPLSTYDDLKTFSANTGYNANMHMRAWNAINRSSLGNKSYVPSLSDYEPYGLDYGRLSKCSFDIDVFLIDTMGNTDYGDPVPVGIRRGQDMAAIDNLSLLSFVRAEEAAGYYTTMRGLGKKSIQFLKDYCGTIFPPEAFDRGFSA